MNSNPAAKKVAVCNCLTMRLIRSSSHWHCPAHGWRKLDWPGK